MKLILSLSLLLSAQFAFATCMQTDVGPAQCNQGSGNGQSVRTIQPGADMCPGRRVAFCPKALGASLSIDLIKNEDRCVKVTCYAPGGGNAGAAGELR